MGLAEINYEVVFSQTNYINALDEISKTDKDASPDTYKFARDKADAYKKLYEKSIAYKDLADKYLIAEKIATQADEKAKAKDATAEDKENAKKANSNLDTVSDLIDAIAFESAAYQQNYSVVLGNYTGDMNYDMNRKVSIGRTGEISILGIKTDSNALPTLGTATYNGKAFQDIPENIGGAWTSNVNEGTLSYNVNFTERTGSGSITGLGNAITLEKGAISGTDISSTVKQADLTGNYSLGFYGKHAEEVAGKIVFTNNDSIGFGGTRGDVK
nr:Slam-dependent surface lipoprotein [Acinetobacter rathckeae]